MSEVRVFREPNPEQQHELVNLARKFAGKAGGEPGLLYWALFSQWEVQSKIPDEALVEAIARNIKVDKHRKETKLRRQGDQWIGSGVGVRFQEFTDAIPTPMSELPSSIVEYWKTYRLNLLGVLTSKQRKYVELKLSGRTHAEIAQEDGVSVTNVYHVLDAAYERMRREDSFLREREGLGRAVAVKVEHEEYVQRISRLLKISPAELEEAADTGQTPALEPRLSLRQRQIACLIANGQTCPDIAAQLGLSKRTVDNTRQAIYARLGVQGIAELTQYCLAVGWTQNKFVKLKGES